MVGINTPESRTRDLEEKKLGLAVISECEIFMIKVPGKTHQAGFLSYYHFIMYPHT